MTSASPPTHNLDYGTSVAVEPCRDLVFKWDPRAVSHCAQVDCLASVRAAGNTQALGFMVTLPKWGKGYQECKQQQQDLDLPVQESDLLLPQGWQHGRQLAEDCPWWAPRLRQRECPCSESLGALPWNLRNTHALCTKLAGATWAGTTVSWTHSTTPCLLQHRRNPSLQTVWSLGNISCIWSTDICITSINQWFSNNVSLRSGQRYPLVDMMSNE